MVLKTIINHKPFKRNYKHHNKPRFLQLLSHATTFVLFKKNPRPPLEVHLTGRIGRRLPFAVHLKPSFRGVG